MINVSPLVKGTICSDRMGHKKKYLHLLHSDHYLINLRQNRQLTYKMIWYSQYCRAYIGVLWGLAVGEVSFPLLRQFGTPPHLKHDNIDRDQCAKDVTIKPVETNFESKLDSSCTDASCCANKFIEIIYVSESCVVLVMLMVVARAHMCKRDRADDRTLLIFNFFKMLEPINEWFHINSTAGSISPSLTASVTILATFRSHFISFGMRALAPSQEPLCSQGKPARQYRGIPCVVFVIDTCS